MYAAADTQVSSTCRNYTQNILNVNETDHENGMANREGFYVIYTSKIRIKIT